MADITMPQLGETVTEGTITRWAKKVGDTVDEDEILFEVSTDKVDSEVPSPAAGILAEILVQEGETADVGAKLAVINDAGEGDAAATSNGGAGAQAPAEADAGREAGVAANGAAPDEPGPDEVAETEGAGGSAPVQEQQEQPAEQEPPAQERRAPAAEAGGPVTAPAGQPAPAPAGRPPSAPDGVDGASGQGRVLSPVVRRLLNEHGLRPEEVNATGTGGRITRADVLAVIDRRGAGGPARAASAPGSTAPTTA
ncbi:MAG TPA: biotin/lipoyl-containing protein, partial [Acidimicrobiales bacterium]|nr:biotin/lipoyl-containing protein [Acidimicrobiales bacterium]